MKMKLIILSITLLITGTGYAQVSGCTDPLSNNYNPLATINDGSCTYASASVAPAASVTLPAQVNETSGLIQWGGTLYTHNDNSNTNLYALSTSGAVTQTLDIPGVTNIDWEEISQDEDYIYLGDFGNNSSGNRTNLKIYKVEKASLLAGSPVVSTINFSYSNQTNFAAAGGNNTDFDCEAFIVSESNIYLFTKQWVTKKTSVYSLPKTAGTYVANFETTFNVNGLITGATYLEDKKLVVLTGYSPAVQPFLYLLYDFNGTGFFNGNKRKIGVSLAFNQTEGITTENGLDYYVSNEHLSQSFLNIPQKLHRFDLRPFLSNYIPEPVSTVWDGTAWTNGIPASDMFHAVIEGDYDSGLNGEIHAATLTINSGTVVVASGTGFTIRGAVTIADTAAFTIEDNANLMQVDNVANTGTARVNKNSNPLYHLDYTFWSSPASGPQTLKQFSPQTLDHRFYVYNTANDDFDNYQTSSGTLNGNPSEITFTPAKAYLIRMPAGQPANQQHIFEGSFTGTPNNGIITIPLETGGGRINGVGNPYPSPINIYDFIDSNSGNFEDGTLYFWRKRNNPDATSYAVINKFAYIANVAEGGDTGSDTFTGDPSQWVINPGQGFFVQASAAAGDLTFTNSMRRDVNNSQFFRMNDDSLSSGNAASRFWLNIEDTQGGFGQTVTGYTSAATFGLDFGLDGKLMSEGQTTLYTIAGETELSIQARPQFTTEDVVPLGYYAATAGSYTISLADKDGLFSDGQPIVLKDKVLNNEYDLTQGSYQFTTDAGPGNERFEIVYVNSTLTTNPVTISDVVLYQQGGTIHLDAGNSNIDGVMVFDISGRNIYSRNSINASQTTLTGIQAGKQVLLVQITLTDTTVVTKKIIN